MVTPVSLVRPDLIPNGAKAPTGISSGGEFARTLRDSLETSGLRFSVHARERLDARGIHLGDAELTRITESIEAAASKGARQSVVMLDRLALVVGIPTRTVVTVLEPDRSEHVVFTHIDSVVVAGEHRDRDVGNQRPDPDVGGLLAADRLTRR